MLDGCDIERILPYYLFDYRKALKAKKQAENGGEDTILDTDENIVIRDGKKYRKVTADKAVWADKIF